MTAAGTLWHVTLLVAGAPAEAPQLRRALQRLCDRDPGNMGVRYRADGAELQFWDEGSDIEQVTHAALSLWRRTPPFRAVISSRAPSRPPRHS